MFEKDAEEYYNGQYDAWLEGEDSFALEEEIEQAFKDGAEFGFKKANEWHYVKDGDLPNEDIYLVIRLNDANTCYKFCTGFWEKEEKCFHTLFCSKVDTKDIIAWKEITVPEQEG